MDSNTGLGCGKEPKVTVMLGSGEWERLRGMECMSGSMAIDTKGNSRTV